LTEQRWFRRLATRSWVGRRVAGRFVAGETLDQAMDAARRLGRARIAAMLDHLGENVWSPEQARVATEQYLRAVRRLHEDEDVDGALSVKLTQFGLDVSEDLCLENAARLVDEASAAGILVMIDMEAHPYVGATLRVHRLLRERSDRVGVCLQSALRRTPADVFGLPERSIVRLVKGAYLEPEEVAFPRRRDVDRNFARLFATLMNRGHTVHVATHDPRLVAGGSAFVERRALPWSRVEFQMLYGIRTDIQQGLARDDYPVRVYIPYGTEWYPYLTRRLAERPANMWFFAQNLLRMGGR
jgi:proline dehydrogenase